LRLFSFIAAFGRVLLVRKKGGVDGGKLYAMKVSPKPLLRHDQNTEHAKAERLILEAIQKHPFLVTLHYAFKTSSELCLVLGE
jgi:ribosomal protein S6 kinase alpha-5